MHWDQRLTILRNLEHHPNLIHCQALYQHWLNILLKYVNDFSGLVNWQRKFRLSPWLVIPISIFWPCSCLFFVVNFLILFSLVGKNKNEKSKGSALQFEYGPFLTIIIRNKTKLICLPRESRTLVTKGWISFQPVQVVTWLISLLWLFSPLIKKWF